MGRCVAWAQFLHSLWKEGMLRFWPIHKAVYPFVWIFFLQGSFEVLGAESILCEPLADQVADPALPPEVKAVLEPEKDSLSLPVVSVSAEQAKQALFRYWVEKNQIGDVSEIAKAARNEIYRSYGLDPELTPSGGWLSASRLPEAVEYILSFYLRWGDPDILAREQSAILPDMPVGLDPSLQEFLELKEEDNRLLSEIIFEDFLKDPEKQQRLLALYQIIGLFNNYLEVLAGGSVHSQAVEKMNQLPRVRDGVIQSLGEIPSLERMRWFVERYQEFYSFFPFSAFSSIYKRKLQSIREENKGRLEISFLFKAFEFSAEDIEEFKRSQEIQKELQSKLEELYILETDSTIDLNSESLYRHRSSILEHHEDIIKDIKWKLNGEGFDYLELLEGFTSAYQFQLGSSSQPASISGYHQLFRKRYDEVRAEVAKLFTVQYRDRSYQSQDFQGRSFADPANFLPGARYNQRTGAWELIEAYHGQMGVGHFAGRQTPLGGIVSSSKRELSKNEFEHYQNIAIAEETWRRISAEGLFTGIQQVSLEKLIQDGRLYGAEGFYEDGVYVEKFFEWYDPILERFRDPNNDIVDFEKEAKPKYELILYILNQSKPQIASLPIEYAFLLTWKMDDLKLLAFLRQHIEGFGIGEIPRDILYISQKEQSDNRPISSLQSEGLLSLGEDSELLSYDKYRDQPELVRRRLRELPAWYFQRSSFEDRINPLVREQLGELQYDLVRWQQLVRHELGIELSFQFKETSSIRSSLERLTSLVEKRRRIVPGPSFRSLGCIPGLPADGSLLPEKINPITAYEYHHALRPVSDDRPTVEIRDINKFLDAISECLDHLENQRQDLIRKLSLSFDRQRDLEYARSARRMRNLRGLLEAHLKGQEYEALPDIDEENFRYEDAWIDFLYAVVGAQASDPKLQDQAIEKISRLRKLAEDPREVNAKIGNFFATFYPSELAPSDAQNHEQFNELLIRIFFTRPHELNEAEQKLRDRVARLLSRRDVERISQSLALHGAIQIVNNDHGVSYTRDFSNWDLFELDALNFLVSHYGWDSVATDTSVGEMYNLSLYEWLYSNLSQFRIEEDGVRRKSLSSRLSFQASADLLKSADHIALSAAIIPSIWGQNWKELFPNKNPGPLDIQSLGLKSVPQVLSFITDHQFEILEYVWGLPSSRQRPLQPSKSLQSAFELSNESLQALQRWRVPTDPEHLQQLLHFGDRQVWNEIMEAYLRTFPKGVRDKKRIEIMRAENFPPYELSDWFFSLGQSESIHEHRLNEKAAESVAERMKLNENHFLSKPQILYLSNLAFFMEKSSAEAISKRLMGYDDFIIDFFGDRHNPAANELRSVFSTRTQNKKDAVFRYLRIIGLDPNSSLVKEAMAEVERDNPNLWKDLLSGVDKFFYHGGKLHSGPLTTAELQRIVFLSMAKSDLEAALLGTSVSEEAGISIFEGEEISKDSVRKILDEAKINLDSRSFSQVRTQLGHLRAFLIRSQELFPQFEASLSNSLIRYISLAAFRELNHSTKFQTYLEASDAEISFANRMSNFKKYLDLLGYELPFEFRNWSEELEALVRENKIDADKFFMALEAYILLQEEIFINGYGANETYYMSRLNILTESLRGHLEVLPLTQEFLKVTKQAPSKLQSFEDQTQYHEALVQARQKAFPRLEGRLAIQSIYAIDQEEGSLRHQVLMSEIKKVYESIFYYAEERRRRDFERALPYNELSHIKFKNEEVEINPQWQIEARARMYRFIHSRSEEFFNTENGFRSSYEFLEEILGEDDVRYLQSRLGMASLRFLGQVEQIISSYNHHNIQLRRIKDERLDLDQLIAFHQYVLNKFGNVRAAKDVELKALINKEKLNPREIARKQELLADADLGYRSFINIEVLEEFLKLQSAKPEIIDSLLRSPAIEIQLEQLRQLSDDIENLLKSLIVLASNMDGSQEQNMTFAFMLSRMHDFFNISKGIGNSELARDPFDFDDLLQGLQNKTKEELEIGYQRQADIREQRLRMDRNWIQNTASDIWTMAVLGVDQMAGEVWRLGVENLGIYLWERGAIVFMPSGLRRLILPKEYADQIDLYTSRRFQEATQFFGELEFLGLKRWSNFSKEKLERPSDHVLADVVADGVGLFITVASFGGFRVVQAGLRGYASKAAQTTLTGVRAATRIVPASARRQTHAFFRNLGGRVAGTKLGSTMISAGNGTANAGRKLGSILTREIHLPGYRGAATTRALSESINNFSKNLVANETARRTSASLTGRFLSRTALLGQKGLETGKVLLPSMGLRLTLDSALIAGGSLLGTIYGFGGMDGDKLKEDFGHHFMHGIQFMTTLSAIHMAAHRSPLLSKFMSTVLMVYIASDATRNITGALMTESATFREVVNNSFIAWMDLQELKVKPREYDLLPDEYWTSEGVPWIGRLVGKQVPNGKLWEKLPNGPELFSQWVMDQERIVAAVSGATIMAVILGSPYIGYKADQGVYSQIKTAEGKPGVQQRFFQALSRAYGGNPQRYYEWAVRDQIKALRAENTKRSSSDRLSEDQLRSKAEELVKEKFSYIYKQIHPEYQITETARWLTLQGWPVETLRSRIIENVRRNYKKIRNEMDAGERVNPLLARYLKESRLLGEKELIERFNRAWEEGVRQGHEIMLAFSNEHIQNISRESLSRHLEAFHLLGERMGTFLENRNQEKPSTEDIWQILEEFGSRQFWESSTGQLILQEIVVPQMTQARQSEVSPLFMGAHDSQGRELLTAKDFAALIWNKAEEPGAPAQRRIVMYDPEFLVNNSFEARTEIVYFIKNSEKLPIAQLYRLNGKRYLEVFDQRIELPENIEVEVFNNGNVRLRRQDRAETLELDALSIKSSLGLWGLRGEEVPGLISNLKVLYEGISKDQFTSVPQVVMFDITRIDPVTGKERISSEPVLLTPLSENLDLILLPNNTFLLSSRLEPLEVPRSRWQRIWPSAVRNLVNGENGFVSQLQLPSGWRLEGVKDDTLILRDRFNIETELDFRAQEVRVFYRNSKVDRGEIKAFQKDGKWMRLAEFRDLILEHPGVLPTEILMAKLLMDNRPLEVGEYSTLKGLAEELKFKDDLRVLRLGGMNPNDVTSELVKRAFGRELGPIINATRDSLLSGSLGQKLGSIPLSEGVALEKLVSDVNLAYLERYMMDKALFERMREEVGYSGLSLKARTEIAKNLNKPVDELRAEELEPFERLDILKQIPPEELAKYFSREDIELAWRLTHHVKTVERAMNRVLGVIHTSEVKKAMNLLGMKDLPKDLEELVEAKNAREHELTMEFLNNHIDLLEKIVPQEEIVDLIWRGELLSIKAQNYFALEAGRIGYEAFDRAGNDLAEGVTPEAVREGIVSYIKKGDWKFLRQYLSSEDLLPYFRKENLESRGLGSPMKLIPEPLNTFYREILSIEDAYRLIEETQSIKTLY